MSPRLATLSSPTAEITPRNRVWRGSAVVVASTEKGLSPLLTGLLKSRVSAMALRPGLAQDAGVEPSAWKTEAELCHSVQCGGPNAVLVSAGAGWPALLVGQFSARNICQE